MVISLSGNRQAYSQDFRYRLFVQFLYKKGTTFMNVSHNALESKVELEAGSFSLKLTVIIMLI